MPCRDYDYDDNDSVNEELREDLDKATRIACELLGFIEHRNYLGFVSAEALSWWNDHKRRDEEQRRYERQVAYRAKVQTLTGQLDLAIWNGKSGDVKRLQKELNDLLNSHEET